MNSYGLSPLQLELLKDCITKHLAPDQKLTVWIFGSRAIGKARRYSDIDLLLEAMPPLENRQKYRMQDTLEDSDLPYKVDLVRMGEIYAPYRDTILREKSLLFEVG